MSCFTFSLTGSLLLSMSSTVSLTIKSGTVLHIVGYCTWKPTVWLSMSFFINAIFDITVPLARRTGLSLMVPLKRGVFNILGLILLLLRYLIAEYSAFFKSFIYLYI